MASRAACEQLRRGSRRGASSAIAPETGKVSSRSLRGANFPRYNYRAVRHIYARGNQIARNYSIPLSAKSAN